MTDLTIEKIRGHYVIKGLGISGYLDFIEKIIGPVPQPSKITSYSKLVKFLDKRCEENGGNDPLWDFPLDELGERDDFEYFFVEIFDGKEPRYFETLTKHHIKEIVEYCMYYRDVEGFNGNWIDSIDRNYNRLTKRTIIKNAKELIQRNNLPFGTYNIDLIRGPKAIVQDCDFYECCVGYADIVYDQHGVSIAAWEITD